MKPTCLLTRGSDRACGEGGNKEGTSESCQFYTSKGRKDVSNADLERSLLCSRQGTWHLGKAQPKTLSSRHVPLISRRSATPRATQQCLAHTHVLLGKTAANETNSRHVDTVFSPRPRAKPCQQNRVTEHTEQRLMHCIPLSGSARTRSCHRA